MIISCINERTLSDHLRAEEETQWIGYAEPNQRCNRTQARGVTSTLLMQLVGYLCLFLLYKNIFKNIYIFYILNLFIFILF
jgi:hypothetical protein